MPDQTPKQEPDEGGGGAPSWMLTYGDSVTLLLTFFVLLLTFSTPNKEDFAVLAQGLMPGNRQMPAFPGQPAHEGVTPEERRLEQSRLDTEGAEKPPMEQEDPIEELKKYPEDIQIADLKHLKGALLIRIPLVDLFGTDDELDAHGQTILGNVVKMTRAHPYTIIVRAKAGRSVPEEARETRSILFALRVVGYLRRYAADLCDDIGLSDNIELVSEQLPEGMCEIVLLEV
jgi:hypothetical protein